MSTSEKFDIDDIIRSRRHSDAGEPDYFFSCALDGIYNTRVKRKATCFLHHHNFERIFTCTSSRSRLAYLSCNIRRNVFPVGDLGI